MEKDIELSLEDLDNVCSSEVREAAEDMALQHPELFREKQIERLKSERDALINSKQSMTSTNDRGRSGR